LLLCIGLDAYRNYFIDLLALGFGLDKTYVFGEFYCQLCLFKPWVVFYYHGSYF